ncbi:hypothetical protein [Promicromonospora sp. NPDC057488]|uniref:hypothetical protein n=1 Tax=Promicromonospora sp. NPDC057488 TaxID=3346147 RepID=UPI00366AD1B2
MKKLLAGGTLAILAFGGMIASAAPASAHTPNVTADCGSVNVDLRQYSGADLTVVIDGTEVETTTFDREFVKSYPISRTADHVWSIDVQAHDNDRYDYQQNGETTACETTPPLEAVHPATPETVAGCAASLDDVVLPENTATITYAKTEAGIVATLVSPDKNTFPEDLGNYVLQEDGTALLPTEFIVIEEECEPTPEPSEPSVEPTEEASVPPVDEPSASPSPAPAETEELAATGATVGGAIAFAALLAIGGVALVWARKRMQHNA